MSAAIAHRGSAGTPEYPLISLIFRSFQVWIFGRAFGAIKPPRHLFDTPSIIHLPPPTRLMDAQGLRFVIRASPFFRHSDSAFVIHGQDARATTLSHSPPPHAP